MRTVLGKDITKNVSTYDKNIAIVIEQLMDELVGSISNLSTGKGGKLLATQENINLVSQMSNQWLNVLKNDTDFINNNTNLINKFDTLLKDINKTQTTKFNFNSKSSIDLQAFKELQLQQFNLIGKESLNKLERLVFDSISKETPLNVLIKDLKQSLDNNLKRYAGTYATTSQRLYIQKAEDISAANLEEEGIDIMWEYVGSDDSKTRDVCQRGLSQRFFTTEEKDVFNAETEPRYGCRHVFQIVTKDVVDTIKQS